MRRGSNLLLGESARLSLMLWTLSYLTAASYSYTILLFAVSSFFKLCMEVYSKKSVGFLLL